MKNMARNIVVLLLAAMLLLTSCGNSSAATDEVVLKIDGRDIMKSEYLFYLYNTNLSLSSSFGDEIWGMDFNGQTADQLAEEQTIHALKSITAAKKYAAENDITLTEEEKDQAKLSAEQFINSTAKEDLKKMCMDEKKLAAIFESSYLYSLVYNAISENVVVEESEIDSFFEANKEGLMKKFQLLKVNSIVVDDAETADEVIKKARAGEDFSALFDSYDTLGNIEGEAADGEMTVYRYYLESDFGLSPDAAVGDIEGPFNMGSTYFVLKIASEESPQQAEVKKMAGEAYRANMKAIAAEEKMTEMVTNQTVEKIEEVWSKLEKFH